MRVVGLRLEPGQSVPEHRNAIPVALIVTGGSLHFDDGATSGELGPGGMLLINPGERHTYRADVATSAYPRGRRTRTLPTPDPLALLAPRVTMRSAETPPDQALPASDRF